MERRMVKQCFGKSFRMERLAWTMHPGPMHYSGMQIQYNNIYIYGGEIHNGCKDGWRD